MADPYNFFGQSPAPQAFSPSPQELAMAMQMPEYNNATSPNAQPSQQGGMGGIDPKMLGQLMHRGDTGVPMDAQMQGIPANAQSYNLGAGPLPWLPQNALPWSSGNG